MAQALSRRLAEVVPRLVGRAPERYAQELQDFLEALERRSVNSIPPGFNDVPPEPLVPGAPASPGTEGSGWAAADHTHAIPTGPGVELTPVSPNGEGLAPAFARSDHTHSVTKVMADVLAKAYLL